MEIYMCLEQDNKYALPFVSPEKYFLTEIIFVFMRLHIIQFAHTSS